MRYAGRRFCSLPRGPVRGIGLALFFYLSVVIVAMICENRLIYFPPPINSGDWHPVHLNYVEAEFASSDGTKLHGWYFSHDAPEGYLLYCHGNAEFVPFLGDFADYLRREFRLSTLVWDYRGYGKSGGRPNEAGVLADADAARQWLADREGITAADIILMGRSLGGAVAVHLAADSQPRALVLDSTFTSMPDVAAYHYPFLPIRWLLRTQFNSLAKIRGYHGPLLQLHGDADQIVPLSLGQALFDAAPGPKEFFLFRRGGHNDARPAAFYDRVSRFVDEHA